ncbi:MAG: hypothetical protein K2Y35_12440 [Burkholderiales bacterium]|nr:hypothetical protein [Burkholderiales bacterium]
MKQASTDFRCGRGPQLRRIRAIGLLGSVTLFAFASIASAAVIEVQAIPEPSTVARVLAGIVMLVTLSIRGGTGMVHPHQKRVDLARHSSCV